MNAHPDPGIAPGPASDASQAAGASGADEAGTPAGQTSGPYGALPAGLADLAGELLRDVREIFSRIHVVSIPMAMRFRGVDTRTAMLLRGPAGWAEFSPFEEYPPPEAARWFAAALERAYVPGPAGTVRGQVPVNATVPACAPEEVPGVLARFPGCTTAKVKVAQSGVPLEADIARVAAVRRELGQDGVIRVDANGGWSLAEAKRALRRLEEFGLQYAEQPCAAVEDLAALRTEFAEAGIGVPIAADESIRRAEDPMRVARLQAADYIVVKVQPLGGIAQARRIVAQTGLPAVVSSALDTSIGIAAGVELAALLPPGPDGEPLACGLGTVGLLRGDVAEPSLRPSGGMLPVTRPGADDALLERYRADPGTAQAWLARAQACWDLIRHSPGEDARVSAS
ncbi:o-succinylbenzoate synthase [Sediminivirga luteola]|uniref:o-succinylbenzoate synthase n=1 Tax=Sediminivirga luteola TaxID=1774748 RepID=UPI0024123455|nr:o-succinylbenzoate synthase [Sediminivirga luteola]